MNWKILTGLSVIIGFIWIYNRLIHARNVVSEAWSGIDVHLKKRFDLIPNLVAAVQAYQRYEAKLFEEVARLRSQNKINPAILEKGENEIAHYLRGLLTLQESYPELKANQNFVKLQDELSEVEDHLQYARRYYNGAVRLYNTKIESFPGLMIARLFGFKPHAFFEIEFATERKNPALHEKNP